MRRSPAVVDRKAIAEHAWADETDPLGSNAIDVQLSRLRAKLPERRHPDRHGPRRRLPAGGGMTAAAAALPSVRAQSRSGSPSSRPAVVAVAYLASASAVVAIVEREPDRPDRPAAHRRPSSASPHDRGRTPTAARTTGAARRSGSAARRSSSGRSTRTARSTPTATNAGLPGRVRDVDRADDGHDRRRRRSGSPGRPVGDDCVVVGQTLEAVDRDAADVILAELLIAPILLVVVFLGAVAIGRRVAAPIEAARQRQLEFTADASHELRTPLAVIEAHTSLALAQDRERRLVPHARSARSTSSRKRMRRLARGPPVARPVRRLEAAAGRRAGRPRRCWPARRSTGSGSIAETRRLTIDGPAPPTGAVVAAPPEWLDRLLGVLLDNACKYAPDGGRVDVTVAIDGSRVRADGRRRGPGHPRGRADADLRSVPPGDRRGRRGGPGLAIADAIVRATGGRWRVASSPSGGARMGVSWTRALA